MTNGKSSKKRANKKAVNNSGENRTEKKKKGVRGKEARPNKRITPGTKKGQRTPKENGGSESERANHLRKALVRNPINIQSEKTFLNKLAFRNLNGWIEAYKNFDKQKVQAAMFRAARRDMFLSLNSAALKFGCSRKAWETWEKENAPNVLQWNTKAALVETGFFYPQHFGVESNLTFVEPPHFSNQQPSNPSMA